MPEFEFEVSYPERYLQKLTKFSYLMDLASKQRYPSSKNASKRENDFFRVLFRHLATISFWLFIFSNEVLKRFFKIDYFEEDHS